MLIVNILVYFRHSFTCTTLNFTPVETGGEIREVKVIEANKTKSEYIRNSPIFTTQIVKIFSGLEIQISQLLDKGQG